MGGGQQKSLKKAEPQAKPSPLSHRTGHRQQPVQPPPWQAESAVVGQHTNHVSPAA